MVKGKSENITQKPILRASNTSELPLKRENEEDSNESPGRTIKKRI